MPQSSGPKQRCCGVNESVKRPESDDHGFLVPRSTVARRFFYFPSAGAVFVKKQE